MSQPSRSISGFTIARHEANASTLHCRQRSQRTSPPVKYPLEVQHCKPSEADYIKRQIPDKPRF